MTVIVKNAGKFEGVHYSANSVQNLTAALEKRMVEDGFATYGDPSKITVSRPSLPGDSNKDPLVCTSASPVTYTLSDNISAAMRITQNTLGGVVTMTSDASAEMTGVGGLVITSISTTGLGSMILVEPIDLTVFPKKYLVIKGGA